MGDCQVPRRVSCLDLGSDVMSIVRHNSINPHISVKAGSVTTTECLDDRQIGRSEIKSLFQGSCCIGWQKISCVLIATVVK